MPNDQKPLADYGYTIVQCPNDAAHCRVNDLCIFKDLQEIAHHERQMLLGIGAAAGENAVQKATAQAIASLRLDSMYKNAVAISLYIQLHWNYPSAEIFKTVGEICNKLNDDCDIQYNLYYNNRLAENEVQVIIVLAGIDTQN